MHNLAPLPLSHVSTLLKMHINEHIGGVYGGTVEITQGTITQGKRKGETIYAISLEGIPVTSFRAALAYEAVMLGISKIQTIILCLHRCKEKVIVERNRKGEELTLYLQPNPEPGDTQANRIVYPIGGKVVTLFFADAEHAGQAFIGLLLAQDIQIEE